MCLRCLLPPPPPLTLSTLDRFKKCVTNSRQPLSSFLHPSRSSSNSLSTPQSQAILLLVSHSPPPVPPNRLQPYYPNSLRATTMTFSVLTKALTNTSTPTSFIIYTSLPYLLLSIQCLSPQTVSCFCLLYIKCLTLIPEENTYDDSLTPPPNPAAAFTQSRAPQNTLSSMNSSNMNSVHRVGGDDNSCYSNHLRAKRSCSFFRNRSATQKSESALNQINEGGSSNVSILHSHVITSNSVLSSQTPCN